MNDGEAVQLSQYHLLDDEEKLTSVQLIEAWNDGEAMDKARAFITKEDLVGRFLLVKVLREVTAIRMIDVRSVPVR